MVKKIQVVLSEDVNKLGASGDLVEVAPGYARNYLIPKGIGVIATRGIIKQVEARKEKERQRLLAEKEAAGARKTALQTVGQLTIRKQVGEGNAIFGTVTAQDIADAIKEQAGQDVDRRGITLPEINQTGTYEAQVRLHPEVTATVEFQVSPQ